MPIDVQELRRKLGEGGEWLGAARRWVQNHKLNGDKVTWGSNEELRPPLTMGEIEEVCLEAVIAHVVEEHNRELARLAKIWSQ